MRFKHRAEYAALRVVLVVFRLLPHRAALRAGSGLAALAHHGFGWRKAEAHRRIREVMGAELPEKEVHRIAWISFRNLVWNSVELARFHKLSETWFQAHYDTDATVELIRSKREEFQRGAILVIGHSGNWDLAAMYLARIGLPFVAIARAQKNPLTNQYLNRFREISGASVVDRADPQLLRTLIKELEAGKVIGILIDLRSKAPVAPSTFLGKPANLVNGLALLASGSGAPVIPIHLQRDGMDHHQWSAGEVFRIEDRKDKAARGRLLQDTLDILSQKVLDHPEGYFWYNKRWVLEPFEPNAAP